MDSPFIKDGKNVLQGNALSDTSIKKDLTDLWVKREKAKASGSSILLWFCFLLEVAKWLSLCFRLIQLLSLSLPPSIPSLSHFDVPWIIKVVLRSPARKRYIPKQDCYLLCFGCLSCFVYERKNFGISNACRLPLKSVKSCGRSILVLWQITSFREEASGKPTHNLSTIILHQLCSKGTQLTNWAGSKPHVSRLYEKVFIIFERNLTSLWSA